MDDTPREKLREIILKEGSGVCSNKARCKGLLLDYCPDARKEVNLLITALDEGVAEELLRISSGNTPNELLVKRLTQRLCDDRSLENAAARWAVEAWIFALGMKVPQATTGPVTPPPPPPTPPRTAPYQRPSASLPPVYTGYMAEPRTDPGRTSPPYVPRSDLSPPTPIPPSSLHTYNRQATSPTPAYSAPAVYPPTRTAQPYRRRTRPRYLARSFGNLLLFIVGIVLLVAGERSYLSLGISDYSLFPVSLYIVSALLGPRWGLAAGLTFLGLGIIGVPIYPDGDFPLWSIHGLLFLSSGTGESNFPMVLYHLVCPLTLLIVGALYRSSYRVSFWRGVFAVLLGYILYTLFHLGLYVFILQYTFSDAFSLLLPLQVMIIIMALITTIPVYFINLMRD